MTGEQAASPHGQARRAASPLARRLARQAGIDLAALRGSGPQGRIIKADILAARAGVPGGDGVGGLGSPLPVAEVWEAYLPPYDEIPHDTARKTLAARLERTARETPQFSLYVDCELDGLLAARRDHNRQAANGGKLSLNDYLVWAAALALQRAPDLNVSWTPRAMRRYRRVDIAVAVATDNGLITPVIRDAANKNVTEVSREIRDLSERARGGGLMAQDYEGACLSVSNLGMYGIMAFNAVINPPQAAILALGAAQRRPVMRERNLALATLMTVSLTCDHRVADGVTGAVYLEQFKKIVERKTA